MQTRLITILVLYLVIFGCTEGPVEAKNETQYRIALIYDDSSYWSIATISPDASNLTTLRRVGVIENLKWSPDGSKLAYTIYGGAGLGIVDLNGSGPHGVDSVWGVVDYAWSPDGQKIVYAADTIFTVDLNTGMRQALGRGSYPAISPTGDKIAFILGEILYSMNPDGSGKTVVASNYVYSYPVWSPDGRKIAYISVVGLDVVERTGNGQLNLAGRVGQDNINFKPSWSPDGSKLTYAVSDGIHVVNVDGTGNLRITTSGRRPEWSPDGTHIIYVSDSHGLIRVKPDGSDSTQLLRSMKVYEATWSPLPF